MRGLRRPPSIAYRMAVDSLVTSSVGSGDGDKAIPRTIEILVVWRWIEGGRWKKTLSEDHRRNHGSDNRERRSNDQWFDGFSHSASSLSSVLLTPPPELMEDDAIVSSANWRTSRTG
jgi:hypothetical protein